MMKPPLSVFTTALLQNAEVKWLDEHLFRLAKHALALGIPHPGDAELRDAIKKGIRDCERSKAIHAYHANVPQLLRIALSANGYDVTTRPLARTPMNLKLGERIRLSNVKVDSRFAQLKTNRQEPYLEAKQWAREHEAFEVLLTNVEGYVVDGSRSSPLLYRDNSLISLQGGLQGITREKVLEAAKKIGIHCARMQLRPSELHGQLLMAGTGIGLVADGPVQDRRLASLIEEFAIR